MTLQELKYAVALATERHFGRAAKACFVSQPTLSIAIKKFEKELGIALFERDQQDVRVTETGERVIAQAKRVLDEVCSIKHLAQTGLNQLSGVLKLGAIYTIAL